MKPYRVTFFIKGVGKETRIFAKSLSEAIELAKLQFPAATGVTAREDR